MDLDLSIFGGAGGLLVLRLPGPQRVETEGGVMELLFLPRGGGGHHWWGEVQGAAWRTLMLVTLSGGKEGSHIRITGLEESKGGPQVNLKTEHSVFRLFIPDIG